jgi:hypothetical protein
MLPVIFSTASLILCVFFFFYFQASLRRKTDPREILENYRDEVNKLIFDIDAVTERDASLVEERVKYLKSLLEDLDKKIGVYVREVDRRRNAETVYRALGQNPKAVIPPRENPPGPEGLKPPAPHAAAPDFSSAPPGEERPPATPPLETVSLKEQVAGLAAQGLSPSVIAARLKVSISEVELIIALRTRG